jgi:hypothetical protein
MSGPLLLRCAAPREPRQQYQCSAGLIAAQHGAAARIEEHYAEKRGNIPINLAGIPSMVVQNRLLARMAPETFDHLRPRLQPVASKY